MLEKIKLRLSYNRLKNYMIDMLGYNENEAISTIKALRKTDPKVLSAFCSWFYSGEFPKKPLFGVNVKALSEYRNLDPIVTFLTVDWVAREPKEAKQALSHAHDTIIVKDIAEELDKYMNDKGWEIPKPPVLEPEDTSDIVVTEEKAEETEKKE